ncbi:MAG TPA: YetF domain-containing protein [Bacillales bacterium]|nr:YetF domain-containing protein [Bacillales bacterium]
MIKDFLAQLPLLPFPLKAFLILTAGVVLLKFTGKRSVTQMTIPEVVFMISLGTVLIQPLGIKREWNAVYSGSLLAIGLYLLAQIQIWFPNTRKYLFGLPSVVIKDGQIMMTELKKARLTTDNLEMRLRQSKVGNIEDVELAILEPSGQMSFTLKPNKAPATKEDIQKLIEILTNTNEPKKSEIPPLFNEAYQEAAIKDYKRYEH